MKEFKYGSVGRWSDTVETLDRAIELAEAAGDTASVATYRQKRQVMVIKEAN